MYELIKELENNAKINKEKGLENKVDIDYIIERLNGISIWKEYIKGEIDFNIETLVNDECLDEETEQKLMELNEEDINFYIEEYLDDYDFSDFNEYIEETLLRFIG